MPNPLSATQYAVLAEMAEANMQADFFAAAPAHLVRDMGLTLQRTAAYTAGVVAAPGFDIYNSVQGVGIAAPLTLDDLDNLVGLYHERGQSFSINLSPLAEPAELQEWLAARGFAEVSLSANFYRLPGDVSQSARDAFDIQEVTAAQAAAYSAIACLGLPASVQTWLQATVGLAGWHHYMLSIAGVPAASGAIYVQDGVGEFGWASTLPAFRRRGAQSALLAHRISEGTRLGCRLLSADTGVDTPEKTNPSYRNIERAGFRLAHVRRRWRLVLSDFSRWAPVICR